MHSSTTAPKPALWDHLVSPYQMLPLADDVSPGAALLRLERRIEPFETAFKDAHGGVVPIPAAPHLGTEYADRLRGWDALRRSFLQDEDFLRARRSMWRGGPEASGSAFLLLPIYAISFALRRAFGLGTMGSLQRALDRRYCPDCRYDLRGQSNGFLVGSSVLPRLCPECGASWPLLPPPVRGG